MPHIVAECKCHIPKQQQRYTGEEEAHFKQSADESVVASMAQAETFICLARPLTDLSVINNL